jgi:hypothetical protein
MKGLSRRLAIRLIVLGCTEAAVGTREPALPMKRREAILLLAAMPAVAEDFVSNWASGVTQIVIE